MKDLYIFDINVVLSKYALNKEWFEKQETLSGLVFLGSEALKDLSNIKLAYEEVYQRNMVKAVKADFTQNGIPKAERVDWNYIKTNKQQLKDYADKVVKAEKKSNEWQLRQQISVKLSEFKYKPLINTSKESVKIINYLKDWEAHGEWAHYTMACLLELIRLLQEMQKYYEYAWAELRKKDLDKIAVSQGLAASSILRMNLFASSEKAQEEHKDFDLKKKISAEISSYLSALESWIQAQRQKITFALAARITTIKKINDKTVVFEDILMQHIERLNLWQLIDKEFPVHAFDEELDAAKFKQIMEFIIQYNGIVIEKLGWLDNLNNEGVCGVKLLCKSDGWYALPSHLVKGEALTADVVESNFFKPDLLTLLRYNHAVLQWQKVYSEGCIKQKGKISLQHIIYLNQFIQESLAFLFVSFNELMLSGKSIKKQNEYNEEWLRIIKERIDKFFSETVNYWLEECICLMDKFFSIQIIHIDIFKNISLLKNCLNALSKDILNNYKFIPILIEKIEAQAIKYFVTKIFERNFVLPWKDGVLCKIKIDKEQLQKLFSLLKYCLPNLTKPAEDLEMQMLVEEGVKNFEGLQEICYSLCADRKLLRGILECEVEILNSRHLPKFQWLQAYSEGYLARKWEEKYQPIAEHALKRLRYLLKINDTLAQSEGAIGHFFKASKKDYLTRKAASCPSQVTLTAIQEEKVPVTMLPALSKPLLTAVEVKEIEEKIIIIQNYYSLDKQKIFLGKTLGDYLLHYQGESNSLNVVFCLLNDLEVRSQYLIKRVHYLLLTSPEQIVKELSSWLNFSHNAELLDKIFFKVLMNEKNHYKIVTHIRRELTENFLLPDSRAVLIAKLDQRFVIAIKELLSIQNIDLQKIDQLTMEIAFIHPLFPQTESATSQLIELVRGWVDSRWYNIYAEVIELYLPKPWRYKYRYKWCTELLEDEIFSEKYGNYYPLNFSSQVSLQEWVGEEYFLSLLQAIKQYCMTGQANVSVYLILKRFILPDQMNLLLTITKVAADLISENSIVSADKNSEISNRTVTQNFEGYEECQLIVKRLASLEVAYKRIEQALLKEYYEEFERELLLQIASIDSHEYWLFKWFAILIIQPLLTGFREILADPKVSLSRLSHILKKLQVVNRSFIELPNAVILEEWFWLLEHGLEIKKLNIKLQVANKYENFKGRATPLPLDRFPELASGERNQIDIYELSHTMVRGLTSRQQVKLLRRLSRENTELMELDIQVDYVLIFNELQRQISRRNSANYIYSPDFLSETECFRYEPRRAESEGE